MKTYGRDRGVVIVGTTGSVVIDTGGSEVYDLNGVKTSEHMVGKAAASSDLTGADSLTDSHFANFIAAIRTGEKLTQPIESGNISVTMLQLSNIAWDVRRELKVDPATGNILEDKEAMKSWGRDYEKGWAPAPLTSAPLISVYPRMHSPAFRTFRSQLMSINSRLSRRRFTVGAGAAVAMLAAPIRAFAAGSKFKVGVISDEISQDFDHACFVIAKDFGLH